MYEIHIIATWLHIISAVYWLGAIFFILTALGPVMKSQPGQIALPIMSGVQTRVRGSFWLPLLYSYQQVFLICITGD